MLDPLRLPPHENPMLFRQDLTPDLRIRGLFAPGQLAPAGFAT